LTFDDGPHPEHTPRLCDVLKNHEVAATFFVVGQEAERYPDLVRRIAAEGHVVGMHSYTHSEPGMTSARKLLDEIQRTQELLARLVGKSVSLFRPPHGRVTAWKLWSLWRAGLTVVFWNVDTKDYACRSSAELSSWFDTNPLQGGDLVLFHDNRPHAAQALPDVLRDAKQRGLRFATVDCWAH
jgi:peptidoglycan/xylan/chitin deacetylase (PgdA/CDA1 family)